MRRIKAIIFDMDGLMFDTEKLWLESFIEAGKDLGYSLTSNLHNKIIGTNKESQIRILKDELGEDFPHIEFEDLYRKIMKDKMDNNKIEAKPGLFELLDYLVNKNYVFAIASSSNEETIMHNLNDNNISSTIFSAIVNGTMINKGKPSPDIFLKTCDLLGVQPQNAIVLEDSNNGIKAAYDAGCIPVLIPDINIIKDETKKMASHICKDLHAFLELLDKEMI